MRSWDLFLLPFLIILTVGGASSSLVINTPDNSTYTEDSLTFNISGTGSTNITSANLSIDTGSNQTMTDQDGFYSLIESNLDEGSHNVSFWAENDTNKILSATEYFSVDTKAPKFTIQSPEKTFLSGNFWINVTWVSDDVNKKEYSLNASGPSGTLNDSIGGSLSDKVYNITYNLTDSAGNSNIKSEKIVYDTTPPSINLNSPSDGDWENETFEVNAIITDNLSPIVSSEYNVSNGSVRATGDLNATVNKELTAGEYKIVYIAEDKAGNKATSSINITLDLETPNMTPLSPQDGEVVQGNFSVEGAASDSRSGIDRRYFKVGDINSSLNSTVNSTKLSEGSQIIEFFGVDKAGNTNSTDISITVDNKPPEIDSVMFDDIEAEDNETIPEDFLMKFEAEDKGSSIQNYIYKFEGTNNDFTKTNETENTVNLSQGTFNLSLKLVDENNNWLNTTYVNYLEVDRNSPNLDVNFSEPVNSWLNDSVDVDASCEDDKSGGVEIGVFKDGSIFKDWQDTDSISFEISDGGSHKYTFKCRDRVGNVNGSLSKFVKIDDVDPKVSGVSPSDGSENVDTNLELGIVLESQGNGAGLDKKSSDVILYGKGKLDSLEWFPESDSGTAKFSELKPFTEYKIGINLVDKANNTNSMNVTLETGKAAKKKVIEREKSLGLGIAKVEASNIAKNGNVTVNFKESKSLKKISISTDQSLENLSMSIQELSSPPSDVKDPLGEVYSYFDVKEDLNTESISSAKVSFDINKSLINQSGYSLEGLKFKRLEEDGSWKKINLSVDSENQDKVSYSAEVGKLSGYVLTFEDSEGSSDESGGAFLGSLDSMDGEDQVSLVLIIAFLASFSYFLIQLMSLKVDLKSTLSINYSVRSYPADSVNL